MTDRKCIALRNEHIVNTFWDENPSTLVVWKKLYPDAQVPEYATAGAAAMDGVVYFDDVVKAAARRQMGQDVPDEELVYTLHPGLRVSLSLGVQIALRPGTELQVRSRSGLAIKNGVMVLNSPGTIDEDYRGELRVILLNTDPENAFTIEHGARVCQLVIAPVLRGDQQTYNVEGPSLTDIVGSTERGANGFGSTGV